MIYVNNYGHGGWGWGRSYLPPEVYSTSAVTFIIHIYHTFKVHTLISYNVCVLISYIKNVLAMSFSTFEKLFSRFYPKKIPSKKSKYAKKNRLKILYRMPYSKNRDLFSRTNFDHFQFSSKIWKTRICGGWINLFNPQKSTQPSLSKGLPNDIIWSHVIAFHNIISYDMIWFS